MDKKNVEAIYPLAPMQQALLFHSLRAHEEDPGLLQLQCTLRGPLDHAAFERAWEHVLIRHPALRTSLHWHELDRPLQVVLRRVRLPWTRQDWTNASPVEQQERLDAFLHADRARSLDLSRAPVMRLALLQVANDQWHLVWTCHHVLLDGWSGALVLNDVSVLYDAYCRNKDVPLTAARSYRDYVGWLRQQEAGEAEAFWRQTLAGITAPTPLPFERPLENGAESSGYRRQETELTATATAALQEAVRQHRLTLNTLVQGAWAIILSHHSGREEVMFGATVSGRSANLPGIESMVGLFINTLPVRVHIARDASTLSVLKELHNKQAALRNYEYISLERMHAWSDMPSHQRLFESLLVFENYPLETATAVHDRSLEIHDLQGGITTNYPLTIVVAPGEALSLQIVYDSRRFPSDRMTQLLYQLQTMLQTIAAEPNRPIVAILPTADTKKKSAATDAEQIRGSGHATSSRSTSGATFVAPRDPLELQLAKIWEREMHVRPIGVHDDFFALGGHSLLAARLFNKIERAFGRKLPLASLFQLSTVEQLARALRDEGWSPPWSSLVAMAPGGSRPPLYCIHSWEGDLLFYRDLARHMDPDQAVYGLQAVGLDGTAQPLNRVEDMAAHYIREIQTLQPQGPYALVGRCFGIAVAFEMAQQLFAQGQEVAELFILDSAFYNRLPKSQTEEGLQKPTSYYAHRIRGLWKERALLDTLREHIHWRMRRIKHRWRKTLEGPQQKRARRVKAANREAWQTYEPQPYPGRITFIRSSEWAGLDQKNWRIPMWSELAAGGVTARAVPGGHLSMLREPYVQALAAQIQADLDAAYALPPIHEVET